MRLNLVRADIPWSDQTMSHSVYQLQRSDKSSLPLRETPTHVSDEANGQVLHLHHPADAFAVNLRAYISSLIPSLRCRMDVQTSDGRAMILRYVTSYVSKWQDAYDNDAMYSVHVGSYQAAYRHVRSMKPLEPEMWLQLSSIKMSWSCSRRKKFRVPPIENLNQNRAYQKYLTRPAQFQNLSLLQWLREVDETRVPPRPYKDGSTLVGIKTVSPFRDLYYFQHLLLYMPHSSTNALYHPQHDRLPRQIRFFASAFSRMNDFWSQSEHVRQYFCNQGHKEIFVETILSHVASMTDFFRLFQRRVITGNDIPRDIAHAEEAVNDPVQHRVLQAVGICLRRRDNYYNELDQHVMEESSDTSEEDIDLDLPDVAPTASHTENLDWKKFILVTGKPGTGKTRCL